MVALWQWIPHDVGIYELDFTMENQHESTINVWKGIDSLDWFKGKLEPESPMILMGKSLWSPVKIFP